MKIRPVRLPPWAAGASPTIDDRRPRVPEPRQRPRPVVLPPVAARRLRRAPLPPLDQPRAAGAGDDLGPEGAQAVGHAGSLPRPADPGGADHLVRQAFSQTLIPWSGC